MYETMYRGKRKSRRHAETVDITTPVAISTQTLFPGGLRISERHASMRVLSAYAFSPATYRNAPKNNSRARDGLDL